ncbi:type III effector HrpK domain-containing protein [Rhizobium panacihumi]|uniref:type III effector HrpK domain-containing protein n=1 Tax=Rhizobium panacihumi TaxID=2008450 RepID=UPI003D7A8207
MSKVSKSASSPVDSSSVDPENTKAWEEAQQQAKDAGIRWERPANDTRSAEEIINDSPILKNLGNQSGVRDSLEERVGGDIETDADAAYRAVQVLEHIERFDADGNRIVGGDVDNGEVNGFSKGGDAYNGTEAGRLQDFGKYGFSNLKGELQDVTSAADDPEARKQAEDLGIKWERPEGDDRSAQDIIDNDPLLKNLGNQSQVKDMLKERVGDFEKDADAAYRASQVLHHVERFDENGKEIANNDVANGEINGFSNSNEAYHGTEAGRLQDFGKHGFESLKGKMSNPDTVGEDKQAREAAEKAGIKWELPEGDKRSAQDIIDDNPVLKNLGNQSGVKDKLKERVGDFEKDANAAYRAAQVIDRVTLYNEKGETQSGDGVSNTSIDGFSNSNEAYNGTEAGRLQDFGKYGFENLPEATKTDDIKSYKDFLDKNKDADDTSKTLAKYGALIDQNYDLIKNKTGVDGEVTAESLKRYADENPQIGDDLKEALNFFSKPGAFGKMETAADPLKYKPDGKLSKGDVTSWISTQAPKDAGSAIEFLSGAINDNIVSGTDTSKFTKDMLENPGKYSTEDKAAALQELLAAQELIIKGGQASMWGDDYGKVAIANRARTNPDPNEIMKDLNQQIETLKSDPAVVEHLNKKGAETVKTIFEDSPGLKDAVQKTYDDEIKTGKSLDKLWDTHTKDGKTDQQTALGEFFSSASLYQDILGTKDVKVIQDAVASSDHAQDFKNFYKDSIASGKRLEELMKDATPEEAMSVFSMEVGLYNSALDPEFTAGLETQLEDNFNKFARENTFKDGSFDDLKTAYGINGGDELDEAKVEKAVDALLNDSPELITNPDGTVPTKDQLMAGIRGSWDTLRQGVKSLSEMKVDWLSPDVKKLADKGVLHGVSGIMMGGIAIAKGVQAGGQPNEKAIVDITTASVQTVTLLTEGGIKNYKDYVKNVADKHPDSAMGKRFGKMTSDQITEYIDTKVTPKENFAKGVGGFAGIVAGAYGIFDGVNAIRRGETASGGVSVAMNSIGLISSTASAIEGTIGAIAPRLLSSFPFAATAGVLGFIGAGAAMLGMFLPGLIAEGQQQAKQDRFGDLLGDYLTKYEIDGVPNGDINDLPDSAWPDSDSGIAS